MTCGLNGRIIGKQTKWQVGKMELHKMASWQNGITQNGKLIKWQVDKMTCRLIAKWTRQKVDKM